MPVAQRRERERLARRETILDAAEKIALEVGYQTMTMDAVADAAELSKGTLYLYFENKDALCAGIANRTLANFVPELKALLENSRNGLEAVRGFLTYYSEFTAKVPLQFRFAISWFNATDQMDTTSADFQSYRQRVGEIIAIVIDAMQRGQQDGSIKKELCPIQQSLYLWTSFLGVIMARLSRDNFAQRIPLPVDFDALVPLHIETLIASLAADKEHS